MASKTMFDRKWKITLTTDSRSKDIRDLKVTFNIKNTLLGDPSLATFQIFNVNKDTIAMLTDATCLIYFYAGYGSDDENSWNVLYQGEVTNSYEIRQGTEIVWNVWARTAYTLLNITKPSIQSINSSISAKDILDLLVKDAIGLSGTPVYINGCDQKLLDSPDEDDYVPAGTYKEEFDDLLLHLGLGWQVQNDKLIIYDEENTDASGTEGEAIKVSKQTGLLDRPVVDYKGISFTSLLNGALIPTGIINVEPNTVRYKLGNEFYVKGAREGDFQASGLFRIFEVIHRGDTRGDKWDTEVIAFYRRN